MKAGKSPWIFACPVNDPGPRNCRLFLSLPPVSASAWNLRPTGTAVSPQPSTPALRAAASLSPDQKPTVNTPLIPSPSPPTLHPEGSVRCSWQSRGWARQPRGLHGFTRWVCSRTMTGVSHCHSSPVTTVSSSAKRSGKWPYPLEASRLPDRLGLLPAWASSPLLS